MSVDEAFDFEEQLDFGLGWEQRAKEHLQELFTAVSVSNIDYDDQPELQRAGIDVLFQDGDTKIDIKTQSFKYTKSQNLPFEVLSAVADEEPGWFHTSDADLVVWVYENKAGTNLHKTGYLMPLTDGLRAWFDDNEMQYRFERIPNTGKYGRYETGIRLVSIDDIPTEYIVEFDPRLPTDRGTPQSDLMRWADST
jgi:hypothetical protein